MIWATAPKGRSAQDILPLGLSSRPGRLERANGDIALVILARQADLGILITLVDQTLLQFGIDSLDLTAAARDDDVLKELFDRVAGRPGDQGFGRCQHFIKELVAGSTDDIPEFKRENGVAGWEYFIKNSLKTYLESLQSEKS